ncbi:potassium-transporting ATPase subunit KdpC [Lysobacter maris]|uniref:Potassium-transporting ATPase KdpC subunit n=1 Tax=Marilutibacter maris TaxID=1605891 RepID=A0A508ABK2_9GAMM|nr:potassium-transporting ATPase subunit KdpC [Lysobacter maris]KAB8173400.1 potassium-transporting ATPase subunit KdpC [Lysobacter maris]
MIVFAAIVLIGFGLLYSLAGTVLGRMLFPHQATGSLVVVDDQARASALVAQPFADPRYFHSRPSAADYDPMGVAGSNQSRTNPELRTRIAALTAEVAQREGIAEADVPGELVTQSGGGIDPHLSPEGAQVQIARVARERGLSESQVSALVAEHTEMPTWGMLGQPRVNVVRLNLALDALTDGA